MILVHPFFQHRLKVYFSRGANFLIGFDLGVENSVENVTFFLYLFFKKNTKQCKEQNILINEIIFIANVRTEEFKDTHL